ncbi:MAG: hypothetical protein OQK98_02270 [Gammaproteobacteria bacterium]|nr:hypothetical protein [Gammaproteobacteria bacterium]
MMKRLLSYIVLLLLFNTQVFADDQYIPNSGDAELDNSLLLIHKNINRKSKTKLSHFVDKVADDFQVPVGRVEELFNIYEFNSADVLMSISIADVSGEPLQNIAGVYSKNKQKGWVYTLKQMNIKKGSKIFNQIKKDLAAEY